MEERQTFHKWNYQPGKSQAPVELNQVNMREIYLNTEGRNWTEDYDDENGNYLNLCKECSHIFMGYKRRLICRCCAHPNGSQDGKKKMRKFAFWTCLYIFVISTIATIVILKLVNLLLGSD